MRVYTRNGDKVASQDYPFYPFFHLTDSQYLSNYSGKHWLRELHGSNTFRFLAAFTRWSDMWDAVRHCLERYNQLIPNHPAETYADLPVLHIRTDAVVQFLMQTGRTSFKGMQFSDLHRLQLDIETYTGPGHRFSNAERPDDRIIIVALSDNRGWSHAISGTDEKAMLLELIETIRTNDYDVIEGHNIFNFDFPYIEKRCKLLGIEFAVGRDGSPMRMFDARASFAERAVDYSAVEISGRHIIDTWLLLQAYDVSKRSLESYGLKYAAQHFGFAAKDRVYVEAKKIPWYWDNEPETLIRYALDDVHETRQLADLLSPPFFFLSQMVPANYGNVARMGASAKIETLLLREYIHQKESVPTPEAGMQTTGGYTDVFYTGILRPIVDADVESLYPSIMLQEKISPRTDSLGIFSELLRELTVMRLQTKRAMKEATRDETRHQLDAMQSAFKILINSFYGYLGYGRALFNDMAAADRVTGSGQKILRQLLSAMSVRGATVVQVDTDGILFVPPPSIRTEAEEREFVRSIAAALHDGINLAMNGRYQSILSYKKKNYALRGYDGRIILKGSSLTSRSVEKFGRQFIAKCVQALLDEDVARLHQIYIEFYRDILDHKLTVADFGRTENLKESLSTYQSAVQRGERNRTASYEVAIASQRSWRPGDRITYYFSGNDPSQRSFESCRLAEDWNPDRPDENVHYYVRRLDEFAAKFEIFFEPQDFRKIFAPEDLFGFSPEGIKIITKPVIPEERAADDDGIPNVSPRIWLGE